MFKIFGVSFLIVVFFASFSCTPKTTDHVTTWYRVVEHRIIEIEADVADDPALVSKGMYSGFHLVVPYSSPVRDVDHYNSSYYSVLDTTYTDNNPFFYNKKIEYYLKLFQTSRRKGFKKWLKNSRYYMPKLKQILKEENIPTDLAYLPLIESGFEPDAVSSKNAVGLWQFIRSTGKNYGLKINFWLDERKDHEKATVAASSYLKDLYEEFDSWELALASYNCGHVRVRKGVKKTKSYNFWVVSKTLPRETRNYVPKFIASVIIAKNPEKYGFKEVSYNGRNQFVKVSVPPLKSLNDIAKIVGYKPEDIRNHNPALIRGVTPPGGNFDIYVRPEFLEKFEENSWRIARLRNVIPKKSVYKTYRVKNGDSLWLIGKKFGVSTNSIKRTNKLSSDILRPGQKLTIKKSVPVYSFPNKPHKTTTTYIVQRGDTLGEIAQNFGVGTSSLKRYNGLTSSKIKVDQKLEIPLGSRESIDYRIKYGDTLSEIAAKYRVSVNNIKKWNNLKTSLLIAGKNLRIYR